MRRAGIVIALAVLVAGCTPTASPSASSGAAGGAPSASSGAAVSAAPTASPAVVTPGASAAHTAAPSGTATPPPTTAPTTAPPTTAPTPAPTAAPTATPKPTAVPVVACTAVQLKATIEGWSGAMGSMLADVSVSNASSTACKLSGWPQVQLVDATGKVVMDSKNNQPPDLPHVGPADPVFKITPGGAVTTSVRTSNYCGSATPKDPLTIRFILPGNAGKITAAAAQGGALPACMGDPGSPGTIEMNGWAK